MKKLIKLYWNENYPNVLYVMGRDAITGKTRLYVLTDEINEEPFSVSGPEFTWRICSWATNEKAMKRNGFELIGML